MWRPSAALKVAVPLLSQCRQEKTTVRWNMSHMDAYMNKAGLNENIFSMGG